MKYYDEERMRGIRSTLEGQILKWPGVSSKEMMGCLCYFYGRKFFAFLVTNGLVLTKLSDEERKRLASDMRVEPFEMSGRVSKSWLRVPVKSPKDLGKVFPYVRISYDFATRN